MLSLHGEKETKHSLWRNGKKMLGQIRQCEGTNLTETKDWVITGVNTAV